MTGVGPGRGNGEVGRRGVRDDVEAEIRTHFEGTVELLMERGMSEEDAWAEARRRFGDVAEHRDRLVRIDRRRLRRRTAMGWLDGVGLSVAFALRGARRSPGFTAAVVLTLGLGIGANVTMFQVVDRLLVSPPEHVVSPEGVRRVYVSRVGFNDRLFTSDYITYPDFEDLATVKAFQATAAYTRPHPVTMGGGDAAIRVLEATATASLFPLLGVEPVLGRFYTSEEDVAGAGEPTAVLSWAFWKRQFGGEPGVLGRALRLGNATYTVVGVAPEGFTGAEMAPVDVWVPLRTEEAISTGGAAWATSRGWWWLQAVGRLAPGATTEVAEAQATAVHRAARADMTNYDPEARIVTTSLIAADRPDEQASGAGRIVMSGGSGLDEVTVSRWLAGVSIIVLLIACANVANLLLARAVRWRRELAVRMALGVGRARLLAQLLVESLVLALLGAGAALLVAHWGGAAVRRLLLPNVAFGSDVDVRLLVFTGVAALVTALATGLVPALQASRPDLAGALKTGARGSSLARSRTRVGFLVAQAALSVVLLVGAGLFVRSLRAVGELDLGFNPDHLMAARLEVDGHVDRLALYDRAVERLRAQPSVADAAYSIALPFWSSISEDIEAEGMDSLPSLPSGGPYIYGVSPGFFHTMDMQILRGRGFEPSDDSEDAPAVAVVNETFARTVWPGEDALGRCLRIVDPEEAPCSRVVGVVEDSRRQQVVDEEPQMLYYVPARQRGNASVDGLMIRTSSSGEEALSELGRMLRNLDSTVRYAVVQPFETLYASQLRGWRLGATMFAAFGLLALVVAAVGLYSVLAFSVAERRYELGIRAALGATGSRIVTMVAREALALVVAGLVLGALAAWAVAPRMQGLLYHVSPRDPTVYGGVAVVLLAVAAVAALVPARRATRVDPSEALRQE